MLEISKKQTNQISEFKYLRNSISSGGKNKSKILIKTSRKLCSHFVITTYDSTSEKYTK